MPLGGGAGDGPVDVQGRSDEMAERFPDLVDMRSVRISIDDAFNWVVEHWGAVLEEIFLPVKLLLAHAP